MDTNEDIERILREDPIESKQKIQTTNKVKKVNIFSKFLSKPISKKEFIIGTGIIVLIILMGFILIPSSCECEVCDTCTQTLSIETIKSQIVNQGYAEINDGTNILKLSPYTK